MSMKTKRLSRADYKRKFLADPKVRSKALETALDIRKFEIELYWKRATYFWTFIAAALAAFGVISSSDISNKTDLLVVLSCLGLVFSVGWLGVNRGSKYWQENWENHVDMLENEEIGPLYKVVLQRPRPNGFKDHFLHAINGPSNISVSKVNQIISFYVSALWGALLVYSLPEFDLSTEMNWGYFLLVLMSIITCLSFFLKTAATHKDGFKHKAYIRKTKITNKGVR